MFKNYLIIAFRNLLRNKVYSFINIFGLSIGLMSAILIFLWIADEMNHDQHHAKRDVLYKAWNRGVFDGKLNCWSVTPSPLGPALKKEFPEIKETARLDWTSPQLLKVGEKTLHVDGTYTDPAFLTMFSLNFVKGNPNTALNEIHSIVITESLAKKFFGKANPLNQVIRIENKQDFKVTAVMKDLPKNSEFAFEFLLPWAYYKKLNDFPEYWGNNSYKTYVELQPKANITRVNQKIKDITIRNSNKTESTEVFLHPITKWRLYSKFVNGKVAGGRIEYVRLFGIIAFSILVIACINFMNLATARSEKRVKEVGIRKVVGASRESLIGQFLGESIMITFIAFILAVILTELALPSFNLLTEKNLQIQYLNLTHWLAAILFVLFTGTLAGSYPAFYLSSFQPVKVLKGTYKAARASLTPRQVLVVIQFTFSIGLIISTIIVYQQIEYARTREIGYNKQNLVYHFFTGDISKNYERIKKELIEQGIALAACKTNAPITNAQSNTWGLDWKGKDKNDKIIFDQMTTEQDFAKTLGIKIIEGRDIDLRTFKTDTMACIINQTAKKAMRMNKILGESLRYDDENLKIVGVFEDFIWGSPYEPMKPMFVRVESDWFNFITIRMNNKQSTQQNLKKMEAIFKKYNPYYPFAIQFVDTEYDKKFKAEKLIGTLSNIFSLLTVLISCLGLFGLAAYTAEQRTKEIGIRKVLGASLGGIVTLLSKDFLKLVLIAYLMACPIAYYLMDSWLQGYKYRVAIAWWVFVLAGLIALLITVLTVSYQAIKASQANPVKALKYE